MFEVTKVYKGWKFFSTKIILFLEFFEIFKKKIFFYICKFSESSFKARWTKKEWTKSGIFQGRGTKMPGGQGGQKVDKSGEFFKHENYSFSEFFFEILQKKIFFCICNFSESSFQSEVTKRWTKR